MTDPTDLPPHNRDAEMFVVGAMIAHPNAIDDIAAACPPADLYFDAHRRIAEAVVALHGRRDPVDLVSVFGKLVENGQAKGVGGAEYIARVADCCGVGSGWEFYAAKVAECATRRRLIHVATEAIRDARQPCGPASELLDRVQASLFAIVTGRGSDDPVTLEDSVAKVMRDIEERLAGGRPKVIPTGYQRLDNLIGGFRPGCLYVVAARPGVGKTALSINFTLNAIGEHNVLFFSQEMSAEDLAARALAIRSQVNLSAILGNRTLKGRYDGDDEMGRLAEATKVRTAGKFLIRDSAVCSPAEVARVTRKAALQMGIKVVVVDYLQRMQHDRRAGDTISSQVGASAKALKTLAMECGVPVICLAQLNRQSAKGGVRPDLHDLRDSGEIEQEADCVMLLHAEPSELDENGYNPPNQSIEVLVRKQRNGPTGDVTLDYVRRFTEFRESIPSL